MTDRKRIAWELERTAMGDGYYGDALRVAKGFPEATPSVRALLDRWATGIARSTDHVSLQDLARRIYSTASAQLALPCEVCEGAGGVASFMNGRSITHPCPRGCKAPPAAASRRAGKGEQK